MKRFDLVIFDCDGVLVDSEPIANRVFAERLSTVGLRYSVEETMARFVGRTREGCLELARELLGRELPAGFGAAWDAALFEALAREVKAVAGVAAVLRQLDIPFCVASNSTLERMRISLEAAGLARFFEGRMFSAATLARPKPAPDVFLHAARSLKAAPARCAVIEDTSTGVQAALAAGMTVLAYVPGMSATAEKLRALGAIPFAAMDGLRELLA